jgi:hypothetical protein
VVRSRQECSVIEMFFDRIVEDAVKVGRNLFLDHESMILARCGDSEFVEKVIFCYEIFFWIFVMFVIELLSD